ncbi:MAG: hypothetical protein V7K97_25710 [Nostoc sp.]
MGKQVRSELARSSPLALASPNVRRGDAKSDSAGGKRVRVPLQGSKLRF